MAKYELMMILDPSIAEADRNSSLEAVKDLLAQADAKIEKEDVWWDKKLAYKIKNSSRWYYVLYTLEMNGVSISQITKTINLDTNIWRHMFVNLDA